MDKSGEYIDLCRGAREIQGLWKQRHGDFYANPCNEISCWLDQSDQRSTMRKGFSVCARGKVIQLVHFVWLPRLDQLIEMAQIHGRHYDSVTLDFFNWTKTGYGRDKTLPKALFSSLEQTWLAFLMQQKFNKIWDGCTWIPVPGGIVG